MPTARVVLSLAALLVPVALYTLMIGSTMLHLPSAKPHVATTTRRAKGAAATPGNWRAWQARDARDMLDTKPLVETNPAASGLTASRGPSGTPSRGPSGTPSRGPSRLHRTRIRHPHLARGTPSRHPSDTPSRRPSGAPSPAPTEVSADTGGQRQVRVRVDPRSSFPVDQTPGRIRPPPFEPFGSTAGLAAATVPSVYDAVYDPRTGLIDLVFFDMYHCGDGSKGFTIQDYSFELRQTGSKGSSPWDPCIGSPSLSGNHTVRNLRCFLSGTAELNKQLKAQPADIERTFAVDLRSNNPLIASMMGLEIRLPVQLPAAYLTSCSMLTADPYRDELNREVSNSDFELGLVEWVVYHKAAGLDRMIVFDNTQGQQPNQTELELPVYRALRDFIEEGFVIYHHWPLAHCRSVPKGALPQSREAIRLAKVAGGGRRSSQYIQESVCARRYAASTKWLVSLGGVRSR